MENKGVVKSNITLSELSSSTSRNKNVLNHLRTEILEQKYFLRTVLRIGEIAERLQVSATPVREALLQLVSEGLVDFEHQKGFAIKLRSARSIMELYKLSEAIITSHLSLLSSNEISELKGLNNVSLHSLEHEETIQFVENIYLCLFDPKRNPESYRIISRIVACTHIVRREIFAIKSNAEELLSIYQSINASLIGKNNKDAITGFQNAYESENKYIECAIISLATRHLV
ncbi:TPA: GntR family transcriptional regulator [Klebsiella pneumoniae]